MNEENLRKLIKKKFGCETEKDLAFFQRKEKIFVLKKEVLNILEKLIEKNVNIINYGIYFGKEKINNIQLTIEGSQIVGKNAVKNVYEFKDFSIFERFLKGEEFEIPEEIKNIENYPIAKWKNYFAGSIFIDRKRNKILTRISKGRRALLI